MLTRPAQKKRSVIRPRSHNPQTRVGSTSQRKKEKKKMKERQRIKKHRVHLVVAPSEQRQQRLAKPFCTQPQN